VKIEYFKGKHPNFGDDLNPWMWPKLIPDFFDDDATTVFLGIGSIIGEKEFPKTTKKVVFGPGFVPEYHTKPDVNGDDWNFYFVRGPRTARMLDLPVELGIGDSATLLKALIKTRNHDGIISFMPHWESLDRGNWEEVCGLADIKLIDPRSPVELVLNEIQRSKKIITEAMHGAIVADALRVPWVPLLPLNKVHRNKWFDWAESLDIRLEHHALWPSSLNEARLSKLRKPIMASPFVGLLNKVCTHTAAYRLSKLAEATPMLSDEFKLDRATARMVEKVELLKKNFKS